MPSTKRRKTSLRDSGVFLDSDSSSDAFDSPPRPHKKRNALSETSGNKRASKASPKSSPKRNSKKSKDTTESSNKSKKENRKNTELGSESSTEPETEDEDEIKDIPGPYEYICLNRPYFDVDGENWQQWSNGEAERLKDSELWSKLYKPVIDKERAAGIRVEKGKVPRAEQHPDHKWIIMDEAFQKYGFLRRKTMYVDPDGFGMTLKSNWQGYGMQELGQNMLADFDKAWRSKKEERVKEMWIVITALGYWLNNDNIDYFIDTDDGEGTCKLVGLLGCALLTVLDELERADELKPDSTFKDLALVIAYYLELSHDLPAYGIEGDCVAWRKEAVAYFKKGNLDPEKGLFATNLRLIKLEKADNYDMYEEASTGASGTNSSVAAAHTKPPARVSPPPLKDAKKRKREDAGHDMWKWETTFAAYRKAMGSSFGGQHYDIAKMTRAQRATASWQSKDPLAGIPVEELRKNMIELE